MPCHIPESNMAMEITQKTCYKKSFSSWNSCSSVVARKDRKITTSGGAAIP